LKDYPAIEVRAGEPDVLLAIVDDFGPVAVEELEAAGTVRVFFSTVVDRDAAQRVVAERFASTSVDISDEDWARRSQDNITPIVVGRVIVAPPWSAAQKADPSALVVVVQPSMGFGTGHHATTRLCLAALQTLDLTNQVVLDVGTGSGVLALAADRLGAVRVTGIDYDPDAIESANENLPLNPPVTHVSFEVRDIWAGALPQADVVTANLTGAVLVRAAGMLVAALGPGGTLIVSGVLGHERDEVRAAFSPLAIVWERDEDEWVGLAMKKP
jgi:ribosomal protein L11 methyltransferase